MIFAHRAQGRRHGHRSAAVRVVNKGAGFFVGKRHASDEAPRSTAPRASPYSDSRRGTQTGDRGAHLPHAAGGRRSKLTHSLKFPKAKPPRSSAAAWEVAGA